MHSLGKEERRIKEVYSNRDSSKKQELYAWHRTDTVYVSYRQRVTWASALKETGLSSVTDVKSLDVGCGTGGWLRMLLEWGANPGNLHGIDLLPDRIEKARVISPSGLDFQVSNGWALPFSDASMDLCAASTVLSSILDQGARTALADEMARVTSPRGWVMVFDFAISAPRNLDTIGIGKAEIRRIFNGLELDRVYRLILAPPLLRLFPKSLLWFAYAVETFLPLLCTHRLYVLRKKR